MSVSSFCQPTTPSPGSREYYLKKSHTIRNRGWVCVTGGAVVSMLGVGLAMRSLDGLFDPNYTPPKNENLADVFGYSGLVIMAASIPFFISASRNKRKAIQLSVEKDETMVIQKDRFLKVPSSSVSLKIDF